MGWPNIAPSTIAQGHGVVPTPNVTFTRTLSDKTVMELRCSGFYGADHVDPLNGGSRTATHFYSFDTGAFTGGIFHWHDARIWRTGLSGRLSHFADDFLGGNHDFKFGVQHYRGGRESVEGYNDYVYTYTADGALQGYGTTRFPFRYGSEMAALGLYADDAFRLGSRLTLNGGIRYDHSRAFYPPYPILDQDARETGAFSLGNDRLFDWDTVSPRVGFNVKLTADGKTVLRAHYGRYSRGIVTGEFDQVVPSISALRTGSWSFATNSFVPESLVVVDSGKRQVDPGFRASHTDQFLVGFERELFKDFVLAIHGTHKRGSDYGAWSEIPGQYEGTLYVDDQGATPPAS